MDFKSFGEGSQVEGNDGRSQGSSFALARQSSIYSLTFDELQSNFSGFGKDFGSMNMDELLKNIWTVEETQVNASTSCSAPAGTGEAMAGPGVGCFGGLQKQGSLTLPRTLSQKTVDQVWKDLYEGPNVVDPVSFQHRQPTLREMTLEEFLFKAGVVREDDQSAVSLNNGGFYAGCNVSGVNIGFQQPGMNDGVTVDKLSENGFGAVNPPDIHRLCVRAKTQTQAISAASSSKDSTQAIGFQQPQTMGVIRPSQPPVRGKTQTQAQTQHRRPLFPKPADVTFSSPMRSNHSHLPNIAPKSVIIGMADPTGTNNYNFGKQNGGSGSGSGTASLRNGTVMVPIEPPMRKAAQYALERHSEDSSPSPYGYSPVMRGRSGNAGVEKAVERKRRRMIKNRESAARSRARTQAYILELEAKIAKLVEVNQELHKKQDEIIEIQKDEMIQKMKLQWGSKRVCLRRTLTGPW